LKPTRASSLTKSLPNSGEQRDVADSRSERRSDGTKT
jgi:hypothetical protein